MRASLVAIALVVCSCVGTDPAGEEEQPILGGTLDSTNRFPFVAQFVCVNGAYALRCSGTLLGPHTLLTAGHCKFADEVGIPCDYGATKPTYVAPGVTEGQHIAVTELRPPQLGGISPSEQATLDFMVVKLANGVDNITYPVISHDPPIANQNILMVGYGCNDLSLPSCGDVTRRFGANTVGTINATDPDAYFTSSGAATGKYECKGDSGGPALPPDGSPVVVGMDSHGATSDCRQGSYWSLAASHRYWIARQLLTLNSAIDNAYNEKLGGNDIKESNLGVPVSEEIATCGGLVAQLERGALATFDGQTAYWIRGPILTEWNDIKASCVLGLPMSDEGKTSCGGGISNKFQNGAITYSAAAKAHETHGPIRAEWAALGYECGLLGFPTSDMTPTTCASGFYNDFEHGAITWRSDIGAHETHGPIRAAWQAQHYECGCLGLPKNDPQVIGSVTTGTTVQTFEHGTITMANATDKTTVACTPPPNYCANASDGVYCGNSKLDGFPGTGNSKTLYTCHGHATTASQQCASACYIQPNGHPDTCDSCAFAADGVYCGNSTMDGFPGSGIAGDKYFCHSHVTTEIDLCPHGCIIEQSGADQCAPCGGPTCGASCCPSGAYCGTSNQCCINCGTPGCNRC